MILCFQNCSGLAQFTSAMEMSASGSSGAGGGGGSNGGGYEGKPYIQRDLARSCSDGDEAKSRVYLKEGSFYLARKDCLNMAKPYARIAAELLASGAVVFEDRVLNDAEADSTRPRTVRFCRGQRTDVSFGAIKVASESSYTGADETFAVAKSTVEVFQKDDGFAVRGLFVVVPPNNLDPEMNFTMVNPIAVSAYEVSSGTTVYEFAGSGGTFLRLTSAGFNSSLEGVEIPVSHSGARGDMAGAIGFAPDKAYTCFTE